MLGYIICQIKKVSVAGPHHNPLEAAPFFALATLILLPALLFSSLMPGWAPPVALVGLVVVFLLRAVATGRLIGHTPVDWPLGLLLLVLPVGLWVTDDPAVTLSRTYAFVANLALCWALAAQRDMPWLRWSGWLLLLLGAPVLGGVLLLGTHFGSTKLPFINSDIYAVLPGGWTAFWDNESFNPNMSGGLLALFWLPAVALAWKGETWPQRDGAKLVAVALLVLLLLTQSRGALLAALVGLLAITSLQSRRWLLFWLVALVLVSLLAYHVGPNLLLETILGRSDVSGDRSLQSRQEIWQRAIYLMQTSAWTGVGLGRVELAAGVNSEKLNHAHNLYLQTGAEMGLPGLIAHLSLYLILFYLLLKRVRDRRGGRNRALALGLLGSLIVFLVHGLFDAITSSPQVAVVIWGLFGLMIAVATGAPDRDETEPDFP